MAENPRVNLALVNDIPDGNLEQGTIYMSPDVSGNFIKVAVTDSSTVTIFDGSAYATKQQVTDNEYVVATALNDLNSRIDNIDVAFSEQLEDMALTTAAALNDLNERIPDMSSYVKKDELEEVELSTAMALNDLDARVEDTSSKILVFAESIDDMRLDIVDLSTSISYIDSSIAIIDASISALDTSVSALDASVKRIDASVKIIDASVKRIDTSVNRIDTSIRDMSTYIADISTRVDDNELIVASALSDLDSRIEDVSSRIENAESSTPWEHGDGENSAQLRGTTGAIGDGAVAHFENRSFIETRGRSIQLDDSSTVITYVSEWTISGNTNGTYYDVSNGSFVYPENTIVFIEYNGVKRRVRSGSQHHLYTDYPFVLSDDNNGGGTVVKGGTREITDTYLDNVHVNVTEVTPLLIGSGAVGNYSHVEGVKTSALGDYSHAEGASEIHINTISVYSFENIESINGEYWTFSTNYGFVALLNNGSDSFKIPSQITIYSDPECHTVITVLDNVESNNIVYIDNSDMGSRYYLVFDLPPEYANLPVFDIDNGGFLYCYVKDNGGAFANYSHAEGYNTKTTGQSSHAEGFEAVASGEGSHAEGSNTNAKGEYSHAEGIETTAESYGSHAEGGGTKAEGSGSHAEGSNTNAKGEYSHAEGCDVSADAGYSHAEGYQTLTWSRCSHAEGYNTTAFLDIDNTYYSNAHAEGSGTATMSVGAHAEGCGNNDNTVNIQGRDWNNYVDASYVKEVYGSNRRQLYKLNRFHFAFWPYNRKLNTLRVGDVIWSKPDFYSNANQTIIDYFTDQDGSIYIGIPSYRFSVYNNNIIPKFGTALGKYAHSEGAYTVADGSMSHSEGCFTIAMGEGSHAEGYEAYAFGTGSHAEGYYNIAAGKYSHAEGGADSSDASTTITYSDHIPSDYPYTDVTPYTYLCTGPLTPNSGSTYKYLDVAVGTALTDGSNYYYVVGVRDNIRTNYSSSRYSTIILDKPIITIDSSLTIPCSYNSAKGVGSHAEGFNTKALSNYSHTEGYNAKALGIGSHAEGYQACGMSYINRKITANKDSSRCTVDDTSGILVDNVIMQNGKYAVVKQVINSSTLLLDRSISSDASVDASGFFYGGKYAAGDYSHTEGYETFAVKKGSHAEGNNTIANGDYSHAEGYYVSTSGTCSHAEGNNTIANGGYSHAEGEYTKASGGSSHAEGNYTVTQGTYSHAEGYYTVTQGGYSHAEGSHTVTQGVYSHAEGTDTTAIGSCSHVEGAGSRNITISISYAVKNSLTYTTMSPHMLIVGDMLKYGSALATITAVDSSTSFTVNTTLNPYETWSARNITFAYFRGDTSYGVTIGNYSHAEGVTRTNNDYEHAEGVWNVSHKKGLLFDASCDGNTLFSIGAGIEAPSNAVEVMQNGDVYIRGVGNYDGSNYIDASTLQEVINNSGGGGSATTDLMTNVTYSELKTLRDSSSLVPGMQYYIYDYVTTVGDASLSSAMHPFGVIVTANSPSELYESARICKAENDEYYTNLDAYEIKYCIDNDSSRFGWADPNGTGIVYYMKDDNRNEAYYDFTNILFDNKYTFDYNGTDARLNASANIHDNVIGPHYGGYTSASSQQTYYTLSPNNIVFEGLMNYNNTFGKDCYDLKFANQTMFNTFDGAVWDCSFGTMTIYNHFGSYITGNVFPAKLATSDIGSNTWYVNVSGTTSYIRCIIMPNTKGTSISSRLSISITETGQHAGLNSSGVLKKWLPADLIN